MSCDPRQAADISNQINDLMRRLPPSTQPATILTALCAVMARLISMLKEEDRVPALEQAMSLVREHSGVDQARH